MVVDKVLEEYRIIFPTVYLVPGYHFQLEGRNRSQPQRTLSASPNIRMLKYYRDEN